MHGTGGTEGLVEHYGEEEKEGLQFMYHFPYSFLYNTVADLSFSNTKLKVLYYHICTLSFSWRCLLMIKKKSPSQDFSIITDLLHITQKIVVK